MGWCVPFLRTCSEFAGSSLDDQCRSLRLLVYINIVFPSRPDIVAELRLLADGEWRVHPLSGVVGDERRRWQRRRVFDGMPRSMNAPLLCPLSGERRCESRDHRAPSRRGFRATASARSRDQHQDTFSSLRFAGQVSQSHSALMQRRCCVPELSFYPF